jgi:preprotein translocase subunit SecF
MLMYKIIQKRKIWLSISAAMVALSIVSLFLWGLKFGIDFTGGSLLEVEFAGERPSVTEIQNELAELQLGSLVTQPVDERGMILRFQDTSEDKHQLVMEKLNELAAGKEDLEESENSEESEVLEGSDDENTETSPVLNAQKVSELRYDSVGPSIGAELKSKSVSATIIVLIAIVLYIAWAFRHVSKPVVSWKYGLSAIIALFHDVIITLGIFSILGEFYNVEINTPFVAAILTVLGYSVNDTIVVFDRIRENLPKSEEDFENTVNNSVNQTITRSINTSLTTLMVLVSIMIFGGETIRSFVLALSIGVFIGTYSSIFLASPVLVMWEKMKK